MPESPDFDGTCTVQNKIMSPKRPSRCIAPRGATASAQVTITKSRAAGMRGILVMPIVFLSLADSSSNERVNHQSHLLQRGF